MSGNWQINATSSVFSIQTLAVGQITETSTGSVSARFNLTGNPPVLPFWVPAYTWITDWPQFPIWPGGRHQRTANQFVLEPLGHQHLFPMFLAEGVGTLVQRGLRPKTVMIQMAALGFLSVKFLKRRYSRDDLPLPKSLKRQIPVVLSREQAARLIERASNLRHRTILMTLYFTGMRRSELCRLRTEAIDKERMVIRIR
jgi:hypothetical protein